MLLKESVKDFYSSQAQPFPALVPATDIHVLGAVISTQSLAVLAIAIASFALALAMAQTFADSPDFPVLNALTRMYHHLLFGLEAMQAPRTVAQIRNADPQVYLDGQPGAPLQYGPSATMLVPVPNDGVYAIVVYNLRLLGPDPSRGGWVEAGRAHDRVIEFQAGAHQVRIECNQQIFDTDRSVFVRRRR